MVPMQKGSVIHQNLEIGHVTQATPTSGSFYAGGSVLHLCTKLEANCSIRSIVMGVPKFRNWVTWSRPHPLPYASITVPNLKRIAHFVQKLLRRRRFRIDT